MTFKDAGYVTTSDTITLNGETFRPTKYRWHFGKGVEFFSGEKSYPIVGFKEPVQVN